ncbi:polysaccharide deacetylase family protein [Caulobacter sp. 17J80-11]|uniref:polysaccharide deacetylase family protein n=1 Tax=Caulobacter sp. 17J80-11 TaxID=2763502 RepID=UPI001653BC3A|nr:polysaccharide deacetylase family protein [Caulobacter sp. 17J80-11]MBC6981917.1 polysaccharide deacetylase family protein [Caulobacter sp. 17J80-11]
MIPQVYTADASLKGKLRRRWSRLAHRRAVASSPARPMISFSFDDAPVSAARDGAPILRSMGVRGTFYVCAGLAGTDGPMGPYTQRHDIEALVEAGHEIGCHTFGHLDCGQADVDEVAREARKNREALMAWGAPDPTTFAYPYGDVAPAAKAQLARDYDGLRALHPGLVKAGSDLNQLPAVGVEGPDGEAVACRWMDRAAERGGWLILYTHDVREGASAFGCTPRALGRLVDRALEAGFEPVTVAEGVRRLGAAA